MKITQAEFDKIRSFQWSLETVGGQVYYTIRNEIDARLFWLDFFYYIFADKFKSQSVVTRITAFDATQTVRLDPAKMDILLPNNLEVVAHILQTMNERPFSVPVSLTVSFIIAVIAFILLLIYWFVVGKSKRFI
jgi:hypothetical protein